MQDLIISVSKNLLKLTVESKDSLEAKTYELDNNIVRDSQIVDITSFTSVLASAISELSTPHIKKRSLVFLVEPSEVFLRFVVVEKDTLDIDQKIIEVAQEKLSGLGIDIGDLYFSYQKIAPFVYQFIAIRQTDLAKYLEISTSLGMSLKAVVPWVLLLPKFLPNNDPCVFMIKSPSRHVIALAELNGIYYCEVFSGNKTVEEIQELVQQLSVYKRVAPIHKIYTVTSDGLDLQDEYEVNPLLSLIGENGEAKGYETHLLTRYLFDQNADYLGTQLNLLTLLPVSVVEKKSKSLVAVGAVVGVLVLVVGVVALTNLKGAGSSENSLASSDSTGVSAPVVLSDSSDAPEDTPETSPEPVVEEKLNKEDFSIRVENGAGIQGVAGSAQSFLEDLGYTVLSIGNADTSDQDKTLLNFKESSLKYRDLLTNDLEEEYDLEIQTTLDENAEYDVLLVIGKN